MSRGIMVHIFLFLSLLAFDRLLSVTAFSTRWTPCSTTPQEFIAHRRHNSGSLVLAAAISNQEEIEPLVMKLSYEVSDEIRRAALKKELNEQLDSGNLELAEGIDACIVATGSSLQKEKSSDETRQKQLWALVDMMVQTKTILNRFKKKAKEAKQ